MSPKDGRAPENVEWWEKAVFYQIYPRSFFDSNGDGIGDIPGIIEKLDYLNDGTTNSLGVDAIWFSPFFKSPHFDFGYDISDYYDIDPRYGTMEDFDRLLEEAHRRNIRVLLDLVVNHTSIEHPWFKESRSSRDNPKRDWYIWRDGSDGGKRPPNNWKNNFYGSAWTWDDHTEQYYLHSFLKEQPDLNWHNPEVREAIYDVVRFWLERGADGYRLDVAHHYCKDPFLRDNPPFILRQKSEYVMPWHDRLPALNLYYYLQLPELQVPMYNKHQPETHQILKDIRSILDSYPEKTSVGEVQSEDPRITASYYGYDDELHMNFFFDLMFCRWKAKAFKRCIDRWEGVLPNEAWPAYTLSNHDQMRAFSRYDQKGKGDKRARLLAMMLLTLRGSPFIYYGEEIGMKDAKIPRERLQDPLGKRWYPFYPGRDGARTPMQWENRPGAGFTDGEPWLPVGPELNERNVANQEEDPNSLLNFYRRLIWLRKDLPPVLTGSYRSLEDGVPFDCFIYLRELEQEKIMIALNFSDLKKKVHLTKEEKVFDVLISTTPERESTTGNVLELEPGEGCLLRL